MHHTISATKVTTKKSIGVLKGEGIQNGSRHACAGLPQQKSIQKQELKALKIHSVRQIISQCSMSEYLLLGVHCCGISDIRKEEHVDNATHRYVISNAQLFINSKSHVTIATSPYCTAML